MTQANETRLRFASALVSLALVVFAVVRVSSAAFTDTTENGSNEFTAGSVVISDDDAGSAMFDLASMDPADPAVTRCVNVTYTGTLDSTIKLYGAVGSGIGNGNSGLEDYLNLTVTKGDGAAGGAMFDCTGFSNGAQTYSGTLGAFVATHTSFANGNGSWTATGGVPDEVVSYRFEISLQDNDLAQGQSASAKFTWEAQNN